MKRLLVLGWASLSHSSEVKSDGGRRNSLVVRVRASLILAFLSTFIAAFFFHICPPEALAQTDELERKLSQHINHLSGLGSRVAGYPGSSSAAEYIRRQLDDTNPDWIEEQRFPIATPMDFGATITVRGADGAIDLHCLWPNVARTSTTPPEGIEGHLIDGGDGEAERYEGKLVEGAIVLLDFNCGGRWYEAFVLGAKAVILVAPERMSRSDASRKVLTLPLNAPRYYVSSRDGGQLRRHALSSPPAVVRAKMTWQSRTSRNIVAFYKGSDPDVEHEIMVLEAYYDSTSVVPSISPGAQQACSIAALIEFAELLRETRPGRSILLAATDGHFSSLSGARHLTAAFAESRVLAGFGKRPDELRKNTEILKRLKKTHELIDVEKQKLAVFDKDGAELARALLSENGGTARGEFVRAVNREIGRVNEQLWKLRISESGKTSGTEQSRRQIESKKTNLLRIGALFERFGREDRYEDLDAKAKHAFDEIAEGVSEVLIRRIACLEKRKEYDEDSERISRRLSGYRIGLFLGLDLTAGHDTFGLSTTGGLYYSGTAEALNLAYSGLAKQLAVAARKVEQDRDVFVDTVNSKRGRSLMSFVPVRMAFGSEAAVACGFHGLTFATLSDIRTDFDTPLDTPEKVDARNLARQSSVLFHLLMELANDPSLDRRIRYQHISSNSMSILDGEVRQLGGGGEAVPDEPVPDALTIAQTGLEVLCGVRPDYYAIADAYGYYRFPNVNSSGSYELMAYGTDPASGRIEYARDRGTIGGRFDTKLSKVKRHHTVPIVLFSCVAIGVPELVDQRYFQRMQEIRVLDARTETVPVTYGFSVPKGHIGTGAEETGIVVFGRSGKSLKITCGASITKPRMMLLNASSQQPYGDGYSANDWTVIPNAMYHSALDQWYLDDFRIKNLESCQIRNERLSELHALAREELDAAEDALKGRHYDDFLIHARNALSVESRAYPEVAATGSDTVKAVIFYLALLFPFAFFVERLIFGFRKLEARAVSVLLIFVAAFLVLRSVHPAFGIMNSALVILLAFFLFALSAIVTHILYSKFQRELESIRSGSVRFRKADVSRASALSLAVTLGIANMRRRKLRMCLTVTSIVLVCFTMISMTSITQTLRHTTVLLDDQASYDGFLSHLTSWQALDEHTLKAVRGFFRDLGTVSPRAWLLPAERGESPVLDLFFEQNDRVHSYSLGGGLVGLTVQETLLSERPDILLSGRWFTEADRFACILPKDVADGLDITSDDVGKANIKTLGLELVVIGIFDPEKVDAIHDLNGETITPVDFLSATGERKLQGFKAMTVEQQSARVSEPEDKLLHLLSRNMVLVPFEFLIEHGGTVRSISAKLNDSVDATETAKRLVSRMGLLFYMGDKGQRLLVGSGGGVMIKGLERTLLPMGIACLIVLNTMLGALFERKGEIAIESALGLTPSHIAALFIAEALVLGVLGAVLGYLLGQTVAAVTYKIIPGIELNYSSFSVVLVSALGMIMVAVPTVYPAVIASRASAPSVKRRWEVPPSVDDEIALLLPFTYSVAEAKAIAGYLFEYFESHSESTAGRFCTLHVELAEIDVSAMGGYSLTFDASLEPYDLGVSHYVEMYIVPTEYQTEYEMYVFLDRQSGSVAAWERLSRPFIDELRKRLLAWRTATPEARDHYGRRANSMLKRECKST